MIIEVRIKNTIISYVHSKLHAFVCMVKISIIILETQYNEKKYLRLNNIN